MCLLLRYFYTSTTAATILIVVAVAAAVVVILSFTFYVSPWGSVCCPHPLQNGSGKARTTKLLGTSHSSIDVAQWVPVPSCGGSRARFPQVGRYIVIGAYVSRTGSSRTSLSLKFHPRHSRVVRLRDFWRENSNCIWYLRRIGWSPQLPRDPRDMTESASSGQTGPRDSRVSSELGREAVQTGTCICTL